MSKQHSSEQVHGRFAKSPSQIPKKGWFDISKRVVNQIGEDNISIVAAGIAFYAFLAIFPSLIALISIYGLVMEPQAVQQQLSEVLTMLPPQSRQLLQEQITQIIGGSSQALSWGLLLSIAFSLWSANRGTSALFSGLNIAYDEKESRNFFKRTAYTLLFTLGGIVVVIISMALVIAAPIALSNLGLPSYMQTAINIGRWFALALILIATLTVLYRFAPDRENPKWVWVSWGSVIATGIWLAGSFGFSYYVSNFGNYNAVYGSLAAVVILLLWLDLTCFSILLGAEINSEIEHQTKVDTTTGKAKPLGARGAHDADDIGQAA